MKRITAALSVVALISCGSAQKKPSVDETAKKEETGQESGVGARAAKGAMGGAAIGAGGCLMIAPAGIAAGPVGFVGSVLVSLVCLPFGIVGGALIGGTVAAARSPSPDGARSIEAAQPASVPEGPGWLLVDHLEKSDPLPEGTLYVAGSAKSEAPVRLMVDLKQPSQQGERTFLGYGWTDCDGGSIRIFLVETYSEWGGNGFLVSARHVNPEMTLLKPHRGLEGALQHLCG